MVRAGMLPSRLSLLITGVAVAVALTAPSLPARHVPSSLPSPYRSINHQRPSRVLSLLTFLLAAFSSLLPVPRTSNSTRLSSHSSQPSRFISMLSYRVSGVSMSIIVKVCTKSSTPRPSAVQCMNGPGCGLIRAKSRKGIDALDTSLAIATRANTASFDCTEVSEQCQGAGLTKGWFEVGDSHRSWLERILGIAFPAYLRRYWDFVCGSWTVHHRDGSRVRRARIRPVQGRFLHLHDDSIVGRDWSRSIGRHRRSGIGSRDAVAQRDCSLRHAITGRRWRCRRDCRIERHGRTAIGRNHVTVWASALQVGVQSTSLLSRHCRIDMTPVYSLSPWRRPRRRPRAPYGTCMYPKAGMIPSRNLCSVHRPV